MAIGTTAAILGAAVIGGGINAVSNASATKAATKAASAATAANNQLARETYAQNQQNLNPYIQSGYAPTQALLSRLGISGTAQAAPNVLNAQKGADGTWSVAGQPQGDYAAYLAANPDVAAEAKANPGAYGDVNGDGTINETDFGAGHYAKFGKAEGRDLPMGAGQPIPLNAEQSLQADIGAAPTFAPRQTYTRPDAGQEPGLPDVGFDTYKESDYTKFLKDQGQRNLNARGASAGLLNSGAAVQNALQLGQDISGKGYQDWFGNQLGLYDRRIGQYNLDRNVLNDNFNGDRAYGASTYDSDRGFGYGQYQDQRGYQTGRYDTQTNNLFQLSGQGLQAAGALAGVGQNYVGQVSANNNNQAQTTANAAIAGAQNTTGLVNNALNAYGYYMGSKGGGSAGTFPVQGGGQTGAYTGALNPYRT